MKHLICALMLVFMISNNAFAEEKKETNPLIDFLVATQSKQDFCNFLVGMIILRSENNLKLENGKKPQTPLECANEAKETIKEDYKKAIEFTKRNEKVSSMVKDYYAFWITSMDSIVPEHDELKFRYKERIAQDNKKLLEMSNRIKLELDL